MKDVDGISALDQAYAGDCEADRWHGRREKRNW